MDVEKQSQKMKFRQDYEQAYRNNEEKLLPEIAEVDAVCKSRLKDTLRPVVEQVTELHVKTWTTQRKRG